MFWNFAPVEKFPAASKKIPLGLNGKIFLAYELCVESFFVTVVCRCDFVSK